MTVNGLHIPDTEFEISFARSGGPGGQNVNKVSSKVVLRWNVAASPSLPEDVKHRLMQQQRNRTTGAGELLITSQRFRDQGRNIQDAFAKLAEYIHQAMQAPRPRRPTRPTRAAKERRRQDKRHRAATKARRREPMGE
jgi:ribosome-associated protein